MNTGYEARRQFLLSEDLAADVTLVSFYALVISPHPFMSVAQHHFTHFFHVRRRLYGVFVGTYCVLRHS